MIIYFKKMLANIYKSTLAPSREVLKRISRGFGPKYPPKKKTSAGLNKLFLFQNVDKDSPKDPKKISKEDTQTPTTEADPKLLFNFSSGRGYLTITKTNLAVCYRKACSYPNSST